MRLVSVFASTLIFTASALGQQTPGPTAHPTAATVDQPPAHPITPAQVHELLELTGANRLKDQMMRGMMGYLQKAFPPFMPKDVIDDLEAGLEKMDLETMAVKAYQEHISTEDAAQLIAFYKTPAGRRVSLTLPLISQELQDAGARQGMQISQEVIERHKDEIAAAAAAYRQKQQQSDTPSITTSN